jgi:hypothetical protein
MYELIFNYYRFKKECKFFDNKNMIEKFISTSKGNFLVERRL